MLKKTIIILFFICFTFALSTPKTVHEKDTVIITMPSKSEPENGFNPIFGWGSGEHVHNPLIQSTLTTLDKNLNILYDLASNISSSDNNKIWKIKLKNGIVFSNGTPLTAEDVAFTYNEMKKKSLITDLTMLNKAVATNKDTVIFYLNKPYSLWPFVMTNIGIIPKNFYSDSYGENPIGSGVYVLDHWDKGQQAIFKYNPKYKGPVPNIKKIIVLFTNEESSFILAKTNEADVAFTTPIYVNEKIPDYHIVAFKSVDNRGFNLPTIKKSKEIGNNFTADPKVREAINLGINREYLVKYILKGYGSPAYTVSDRTPWSEKFVTEYNPKKANEILNNDGWKINSNGIREKDGILANLTLLYPVNDSTRQALAIEVANQLKKLGILVKVESVGWDTGYTRAQSTPIIWGWGALSPIQLFSLYHSSTENNLAIYSPYYNKEVDKLLDDALSSKNLVDSFNYYKKAQNIINKDIPWIWLVNVDHLYWVNDNLIIPKQKLHPHGHGWSILDNVNEWRWK